MIIKGTDGRTIKCSGVCWLPIKKSILGKRPLVNTVKLSSKLGIGPISELEYDNRMLIMIDSNGKVVTMCANYNDLDGFGEDLFTPGSVKLVELPIPMRSVAIGTDHIVFVGEESSLYQVGSSDRYKLGSISTVSSFRKLTMKNVRTVSAFGCTFGVCCMDGTVNMWGSNHDCQIGPMYDDDVLAPVQLNIDKQIVDIKLGCAHTLMLDTSGKCYTIGNYEGCNYLTPTVFPESESPSCPEYIPLYLDSVISHISSGYDHDGGITDKGEVVMWGSNSHGQLGMCQNESSNRPNKVDIPNRVMSITCKENYTVVVNSVGDVYGYGHNDGYKLGVDGVSVVSYPVKTTKVKMTK